MMVKRFIILAFVSVAVTSCSTVPNNKAAVVPMDVSNSALHEDVIRTVERFFRVVEANNQALLAKLYMPGALYHLTDSYNGDDPVKIEFENLFGTRSLFDMSRTLFGNVEVEVLGANAVFSASESFWRKGKFVECSSVSIGLKQVEGRWVLTEMHSSVVEHGRCEEVGAPMALEEVGS